LLPRLEYFSERNGEVRTVAICQETNQIIAVVYVPRGSKCRIISARVARKNEKENITTISLEEVLTRKRFGKSKTDWAAVAALTDEDIEASMRDDPDWAELMDIDWSKATVVYPMQKQAISIRLDKDIIDFFKSDGSGYQSRINAVLRHFVNEQKRQVKD